MEIDYRSRKGYTLPVNPSGLKDFKMKKIDAVCKAFLTAYEILRIAREANKQDAKASKVFEPIVEEMIDRGNEILLDYYTYVWKFKLIKHNKI